MKLPLSNRLAACCSFVSPGDRVADIGCDHGYLGIHLLKSGVASSVIAADVNAQPLESARQNAERFGVCGQMTFVLCDGLTRVPRDFDVLVCAGMGADTMISILGQAPWLKKGTYRLILQCQSKRPQLREYLYRQGFVIRRETLARDGKFIYPVMEVIYAPGATLSAAESYITPALRSSGSPLLPEFLRMVTGGLQKTVDGLSRTGGEAYLNYAEILRQLTELEERYDDCC